MNHSNVSSWKWTWRHCPVLIIDNDDPVQTWQKGYVFFLSRALDLGFWSDVESKEKICTHLQFTKSPDLWLKLSTPCWNETAFLLVEWQGRSPVNKPFVIGWTCSNIFIQSTSGNLLEKVSIWMAIIFTSWLLICCYFFAVAVVVVELSKFLPDIAIISTTQILPVIKLPSTARAVLIWWMIRSKGLFSRWGCKDFVSYSVQCFQLVEKIYHHSFEEGPPSS